MALAAPVNAAIGLSDLQPGRARNSSTVRILAKSIDWSPPNARRPQPLTRGDLRQLASHRKNIEQHIPGALERFEIDANMAARGWGSLLDIVYDAVIEQLMHAEKEVGNATE